MKKKIATKKEAAAKTVASRKPTSERLAEMRAGKKYRAGTAAAADLVFGIDADNNVTIGSASGELFRTADELSTAAGAGSGRLIAIYNTVPGIEKPVKRFMDRPTALRRTWDALTAWAARVAPEVTVPAPKPIADDELENRAGAKKAARTKKATGETPASSKQQIMIALMSGKQPVTIGELMNATGWQRHSVRGFIAGALKVKLGLSVFSGKDEAGERVYRINA